MSISKTSLAKQLREAAEQVMTPHWEDAVGLCAVDVTSTPVFEYLLSDQAWIQVYTPLGNIPREDACWYCLLLAEELLQGKR